MPTRGVMDLTYLTLLSRMHLYFFYRSGLHLASIGPLMGWLSQPSRAETHGLAGQ